MNKACCGSKNKLISQTVCCAVSVEVGVKIGSFLFKWEELAVVECCWFCQELWNKVRTWGNVVLQLYSESRRTCFI